MYATPRRVDGIWLLDCTVEAVERGVEAVEQGVGAVEQGVGAVEQGVGASRPSSRPDLVRLWWPLARGSGSKRHARSGNASARRAQTFWETRGVNLTPRVRSRSSVPMTGPFVVP